MSVREVRATGREALMLTTQLLQRVRRADPQAGHWEAADVQWWWRKPRLSDNVDQPFWIDSDGPVAGVLLTAWADHAWQCDPIMVPGAAGVAPNLAWARAVEHIGLNAVGVVEVPVRDDDRVLQELVVGSGFVAGEQSSLAWMDAVDRPDVQSLPDGFALVDRAHNGGAPHPVRHRNGIHVEKRLRQCSLYDPELDLAVKATDGTVAGYSLFWFDPVTMVGHVEPVRVEDEYQRRGIARAMITAGIDRLAARGAQRLKIGFGTEAAAALYQDLGFRRTSIDTWYEGTVRHLTGAVGV